MGAMTLLVDRRGAEIKLNRAQVVCVTYPDGEQHRVGLLALRQIVIQGDIDLPSSFLRECEATGISIILLPGRYKGNGVNLFPYVEGHARLRLAQYRAYFDKETRLSIARQMVAAKIAGQSKWLTHHNLNHDFSHSQAHVYKVPDNAGLMGVEGGTAKEYLDKWRHLWNNDWGFKERNRRPPRDPVNALLSLSYTLAANYVGQMITLRGLDVSLGFLHVPQDNRPSLALDLLEPVRPWVDQWLLQKIRDGLLTPKHFYESAETGCRLDKEGRSLFFPAWYNDAQHWLKPSMRESLALLLGVLRKYAYSIE